VSVRAIPSGRATHASHRAVLRRLGLSVGIAIALAGCAETSEGDVVARTGTIGRVTKTCDAGRAVYTYKSGYAGGIAIVDRAPECAAPAESGEPA
jgi:hypothetical protein